ncbi:MAG: hypothetical protein ACYTG0_32320 [Planctomycetota bacterium]|jgi:hypothetical protein
MSQQSTQRTVSRRKALAGIGASGVLFAQYSTRALAQETATHTERAASNASLTRYPVVSALKALPDLQEGDFVETAGFHVPGDGGGALYRIQKLSEETRPNDADVIALRDGLAAVLLENEAVNYRMFGALSDGTHDDGVQIKLAHEYADKHQVPIVNLSGEFWIRETNSISITTNVHWGRTTFHIDERYNDKRRPRFVVRNDRPQQDLTLDEETKAVLLERLKPGVQIIPELAPYAGHLISVVDARDRIGIRAGANYSRRGWAREELFYVEEEGRIIGDIAWEFKDITSVTATPCNDNYLVIEGGGLHFSGDTPADSSPGYHQLGISIQRSRTIVRDQWMGLESGRRDTSLEPRSGLYVLSGVYDVTLENIRAMPWEKNRSDKAKAVKHGTYGIGGGRMLNCTFRNLTAEAGWVAWGVFGTNLNKNFRIENCRLNRVDVHFHCWNLYISNSTIGFKGITVTGGGDLFIDNTTRHGNSFIGFRRDYGAKWDGHIRLRGCTLRPSGDHGTSVLSYHPANFDYQYPIGFARSVKIEDMVIDYSAAPESESPCWMMDVVPFSKTDANARLFFPHRVEFRNVMVEGRRQGVRLIRIPDPYRYDLRRDGLYDGSRLKPNCILICDNVQLEELTPRSPDDTEQVHLLIGGETALDYADPLALHPKIRFTDCENVSVYLGNCIASAFFERCTVNTVSAPALRGELVFGDCRLQPHVQQAPADFYTVKSTLGTRFTNCTIHAPVVDGEAAPEMVDRIGFLEVNKAVHHYHVNTALGNEVVNHFKSKGTVFSRDFIAKLKSHHECCVSAETNEPS